MSYEKVFSREYTTQYCDASLRMSGREVKDHIPTLVEDFIYIPEQDNETLYAKKEEWSNFNQALKEKYSDKENQEDFINKFHRFGKQYVDIARELGGLSIKEYNTQELIDYYKKYFDIQVLYTTYLFIGFVVNDIISSQGQEVLAKKNLGSKSAEITKVLFSPTDTVGVIELQEEMTHLKQEGREELNNKQLNNFLDQYKWIPCLDLHSDPWGKEDVKQFYSDLEASEENSISFDEAAKQADLNSQELDLFQRIRQLAYIKDVRDVYRRKGVCAVQSFF